VGPWHRAVDSLRGAVDRIVVVASGADVAETVFDRSLTVYKYQQRLPFGVACQAGIDMSNADRVLFINDDICATPGAVDCMKQSSARIVGARLVYPNGLIQHGGGSFLPNGLPYHLFRGMPRELEPARQTYFCPWVTFAAALVDRSLWEKLSGFDSIYKNGYEDAVFCLRAQEIGASVEYVGAAVFEHAESTTINQLGLNQEDNWKVFTDQWVTTGRLWKTVKEALW